MVKRKLIHPPYSRFQGYMKENGIKLQDVANVIGRTVTRISNNNNGYSDYYLDEVVKICNHFGIDEEIFRPKQ